MAKPRLTLAEREVIDAFAHFAVVSEIAREVRGFEGFDEHYEKKAMTPKQKLIWTQFQARIPAIRKDMIRLLKAERITEGSS